MILTVPESGIVDLKSFKKVLDISRVSFYSLEEKDGSLFLKFYDKTKKVIKPYAAKEKTQKNKSKKVKK